MKVTLKKLIIYCKVLSNVKYIILYFLVYIKYYIKACKKLLIINFTTFRHEY